MFKTLAAALFCGAMLLTLTACGSDNNNDKGGKKDIETVTGVQAKYYVNIKEESFEGFTFEIEYTNESGQMEKVALDGTSKFEKSVLINHLPVRVELVVYATLRDKATLTKPEYYIGLEHGIGISNATSDGRLLTTRPLVPETEELSYSVSNKKGVVTFQETFVVTGDGNVSW